jgi:hypothetical protein
MPKASDMASAIAIVRMPPITTVREWVPEWSPTINPNVVITPDVRPKLRPLLNDAFINLHCQSATLAREASVWFIWSIWFVLFIWLIWFIWFVSFIWLVAFNQKTRQTR